MPWLLPSSNRSGGSGNAGPAPVIGHCAWLGDVALFEMSRFELAPAIFTAGPQPAWRKKAKRNASIRLVNVACGLSMALRKIMAVMT